VVPLGEIADLQAGVGFPPDLQGRTMGDYPVAKVGDISRVGRAGEAVINTADHFVDEIDLVRLKARPIPVGSVLFAKIGEAIRQNHRVIAGCELLVDNNAMAAIPTARVESRYLFHFLRTVDFYALASATTVPALRKSDLQRLPVPLPPLPEQRRIAEILDKADALRAKRRAALAQLDTLTQSIFLEMFGRPKDNPKGWPLVSLIDICSPKQWPTISTAELTETGFPVFGANGLIGNYTKYNHEEPTVLITCRGATCGTINVSPPKCYVTGNAMALDDPDSSRITIEYLAAVLRMRSMADTISGTAQPQITRQNLEHVKLPLPPLTLQSEFARRGAAMEQVKSRHHESLAELDAIFASLQHRAFRGEL
jgi:type I restriction enzyme S subunit